MKVMLSSCLVGEDVMYWGGNFQNGFLKKICELPQVEIVHFCPEHIMLGTPRNNMLIHGGDGDSVWEGLARVVDTKGIDRTELMRQGALKMLDVAKSENPDLIILTEGSDSCGVNVILDPENVIDGKNALKNGVGVAASLLKKEGFQVLSHRDEAEILQFLKPNTSSI